MVRHLLKIPINLKKIMNMSFITLYLLQIYIWLATFLTLFHEYDLYGYSIFGCQTSRQLEHNKLRCYESVKKSFCLLLFFCEAIQFLAGLFSQRFWIQMSAFCQFWFLEAWHLVWFIFARKKIRPQDCQWP